MGHITNPFLLLCLYCFAAAMTNYNLGGQMEDTIYYTRLAVVCFFMIFTY